MQVQPLQAHLYLVYLDLQLSIVNRLAWTQTKQGATKTDPLHPETAAHGS